MIHYNEAGNGYPVVLLHGFCENNTCFDKQVLLLKGHYHVICPDLPGSGKSSHIVTESLSQMADAVHELLHHKNIKKCVLIGHSMGGYITLAFAKKYPEMLDGFGLLHSVATADDEDRKKKRVQAQETIKQKGVAFYTKQFVPPMFKEDADPALIQAQIDQAAHYDANGLIAQLEAMKNREDNMDVLAKANMPVFFGVGKYDSLIPEDVMLKQALTCSESYVAYLHNSGHMGHLEETDKCAAHIIEFVNKTKSV